MSEGQNSGEVIMFPLMVNYCPGDSRRKLIEMYPDCPREVPFTLMLAHERQALRNHGQTIQRLKERGGLSPVEAWAVLNDRKYPWGENVDMVQIIESINSFLKADSN